MVERRRAGACDREEVETIRLRGRGHMVEERAGACGRGREEGDEDMRSRV